MTLQQCDPITGVCTLPNTDNFTTAPNQSVNTTTVHYIGDPMCSWCWGISPELAKILIACRDNHWSYQITVGGLRAGGGDAWNESFKQFLRQEWQHIAQVTGQPFGFSLLKQDYFNYDTEPACRAVVTVQNMVSDSQQVQQFFTAVQKKFYVEGDDPKQTEFYQSICDTLGLDFTQFSQLFNSPQMAQATLVEFARCRSWGVRSFPTLLLGYNQKMYPLAVGKVTATAVVARIQSIINA